MVKILGTAVALVLLAGCGSASHDDQDAARIQSTLQFRKVSAVAGPGMQVLPVPTSTPMSGSTGKPSADTDSPTPRAVPFEDQTTGPDAPAEWTDRFASFTCPSGEVDPPDPGSFALLCDESGNRYLLEPASWTGGVQDATAEVPDMQVSWVVNIDLDDRATRLFADLSTELAGTGRQFAMVLDGHVISAPTVNSPITDGQSQIAGNFTEKAAKEFADRLAGR